MANVWPSTIPQAFEESGYTEQDVDLVIRSEPDAGPEITRARSTAGPAAVSGTLAPFNATQMGDLQTFYRANRAVRFQWVDWAGNTRFFSWRSPPRFSPLAGGAYFRVQLSLYRYTTEFGGA
jgi:hypothetical protein